MPEQFDLDDVGDIDIGGLDIEEQQEKEKTMTIRDKLSKRKPNSTSSPAKASSGKSRAGSGFMTSLLLLLLVIVGAMLLWQIMQLSERITMAMSADGFGSAESIEANSSYDYAIDFILDPNLTERMAARGREGWQVVGSRRTQDATTGQFGYEFIFMRKLQGR